MPEPHLRAGDADRSAVAATLGRHMAAGRLTLDEYDERLARAYGAKTYGELAELTADLPTERGSAHTPAPALAGGPAPVRGCGRAMGRSGWVAGPGYAGRSVWASWLSTAAVVVSIWLITSIASGGLIYFWPIWVIGPWGAILLMQTLGGARRYDRGRDRQTRA
jgi:hypothetical protein